MFFSSKGATLPTVAQFVCRKETQQGQKGKQKVLLQVVFDWCFSIRILMRQVYINPVFAQLGTTNLLSPAEPCAVGYVFWRQKSCALVKLFFSEQTLHSVVN